MEGGHDDCCNTNFFTIDTPMKSRLLLILTLICLTLPIRAVDSIPYSFSRYLGVNIRPTYAFSSYKDDILKGLLDTDNAKKTVIATSLHLQYAFSFPARSQEGRICPDAWQGIGLGVNFMGNPKGIGTPVSLYAFQGAPIHKFSNRLSLYYEWNFGASFGWKPCDMSIAASNLIVGSRVNAYINLGGGLKYRLNDHWSVMAGIDLTHYSNGNTSFPNPGVNLAGLRVGVEADISDGREVSNLPVPPRESVMNRCPDIDLTLYGALRKRVYRGGDTPVLLNGRFAVAGLDIAPMWRITRNFRTGPSLDMQWDESTDLKRHHVTGTVADDILFTRPPFFRQVCVGLSGRAELIMPLFSVNLGIGYNIIGPEETRASYQLANLKIRLTDAFYLNVGYQLLNFQKQNNLMLGFGYSFH